MATIVPPTVGIDFGRASSRGLGLDNPQGRNPVDLVSSVEFRVTGRTSVEIPVSVALTISNSTTNDTLLEILYSLEHYSFSRDTYRG